MTRFRPRDTHTTLGLSCTALTSFCWTVLKRLRNGLEPISLARWREEMEESILKTLFDVTNQLQRDLLAEKQDRNTTEETLIRLLEETCLKMQDIGAL